MVAEATHRLGDGHIVVIEHHQQILVQGPGLVEGLEGHTSTHGTIPDHRHHLTRLALLLGGNRHAQSCADGGTGVAGTEGIVFALAAPRKPGQTILMTQTGHLIPSPGQDLVWIGLVPHIPDQPVPGCVEDVMQRDGQFHHTQTRRQVSAGTGYGVDQETAQFRCEGP